MSNFRRHLDFHPGTDPPSFTTAVDDVLPDGGVVLSESWCYPKGGGQPGDTGVLKLDGESIPFGEVTATNAIIHPVEDPTLEVGDEVECVIDGARRNALARMHSAAHIVSAVANERWGAITVGNQLNQATSRMDLKFENRELFDKDQLSEDANYWVDNDSRIHVHEWGVTRYQQMIALGTRDSWSVSSTEWVERIHNSGWWRSRGSTFALVPGPTYPPRAQSRASR